MSSELEIIKKKLKREKEKLQILENEVEEKTRNLFFLFEQQEIVLSSLSEAIVITDSEFKIVYFNDNAKEIFPIIDKNILLSTFLPDASNIEDFELKVDVQIQSKTLTVLITKIETRNGLNYLYTIEDVTDFRKKESLISELNNRLLTYAYRDGVAETAVTVLHDIGNILTAIVGKVSSTSVLEEFQLISQVISKVADDNIEKEKVKVLVQEIEKTQNKAISETNSIIEFVKDNTLKISEIISRQQAFAHFDKEEVIEVNLKKIIDDCLLILEEQIQKSKVKIIKNIDSKINLKVEKNGLLLTISNLLKNALEAISDRKKTDPNYIESVIEVTLEQSQDKISLKVKDNGVGIEKEKLQSLFNFGYSTKERSSGFGLYSTRQYLNTISAVINFDSEGPFKGCTATIDFYSK